MSSANDDEEELRNIVSKNEARAEWGGAAVVFGLVVEVVLTATYRHSDSIIEAWGPVFADALIALGVAAEILFARKARSKSESLQLRSAEKVAEATERAAEANQKAQEAVLETERIRKQLAPRTVGPEFAEALVGQPKSHVLISYVRDASDGLSFALSIFIALRQAEWNAELPAAIFASGEGPAAESVGGKISGVTLVSGSDIGTTDSSTPTGALLKALLTCGAPVGGRANFEGLPIGSLRIVIAPKP